MRKIIVSIVIVLFTVMMGLSTVNAMSSTADLKFEKTEIKPGDTFTVSLYITCENEINGIATSYSYDTNKLELISAKAGTDFASLGEENNIELITNKTGLKAADVFILEFKAKDSISDETTANISIQDITVSPMNGDDEIISAITKSIAIKLNTPDNEQNPNENPGNEQQTNENPENGQSENEQQTNDNSSNGQTQNEQPENDNSNNGQTSSNDVNNGQSINENLDNEQETKTTETVNSKNNNLEGQTTIDDSKIENNDENNEKSKLPYTGKNQFAILIVIGVLFAVATAMYFRYKRYKGI